MSYDLRKMFEDLFAGMTTAEAFCHFRKDKALNDVNRERNEAGLDVLTEMAMKESGIKDLESLTRIPYAPAILQKKIKGSASSIESMIDKKLDKRLDAIMSLLEKSGSKIDSPPVPVVPELPDKGKEKDKKKSGKSSPDILDD